VSRILAKIEGESNFGRQHQSIEPFSFIKAADLQLPIIPKFMLSVIKSISFSFKYVKKNLCGYPVVNLNFQLIQFDIKASQF
jgi:hypothetical protein